MVTSRTGLRGVSRLNQNYTNSSNTGFIFCEQSQLKKSPSIDFCSGFLPNFRPQSNTRQVFKSNCRIKLFSLLYKLFADVVIDPFLKPRFLTREPSKQAFCGLSAFGLNRGADADKFISSCSKFVSVPGFSCRSSCNLSQPQIDTQHFRSFLFSLGGNLNYYIDIIAIPTFRKRGTCGELTSKQCDLIATSFELKIDPSRLQCNPNFLQGLNIFERPRVKRDTCWSKLVNLFGGFSLVNNPSDGLTNVVSFQPRRLSDWFVGQVMQLGCVPTVLFFCLEQYLVTSIGKSHQSFINRLAQVWLDYQLAFYRYCLSHTPIISHLWVVNFIGRGFLPSPTQTDGVGLLPKSR